MSQHATTDIHPQGDVILILEDDEGVETRLRVSSLLLNHASPVFRAMLGPHFNEGNVLAQSSTVEIPMPDDDPLAMELLCFGLHMRHQDVPFEPDAEDLSRVTELADKYDVLDALQPVLNMWLDACINQPADEDDLDNLARMMAVAFKLKLWSSLTKIGVMIVETAPYDSLDLDLSYAERTKVPFYIYQQLEKHRCQTKSRMYEVVDLEINRFMHQKLHPGKCCGECDGANALKAHLLKQLRQQAIWPPTLMSYKSLLDYRDELEPNKFETPKVKACHATCMVHHAESNFRVANAIKDELNKILEDMRSKVRFNPDEEAGMILGFS